MLIVFSEYWKKYNSSDEPELLQKKFTEKSSISNLIVTKCLKYGQTNKICLKTGH